MAVFEKIKGSLFIVVLTLVLLKYGFTTIWQNDMNLRFTYSDEEGYYMYLPAVFIHGTFANIPVRTDFEYKPYAGTNKILTRFTYGIAFLESPFWLAAHLSRYLRGLPLNDPFAPDYSFAILLAACFYTALGMRFLWKTLCLYSQNSWTIFLTLAAILVGTNLLFLTSRQAGMAHHFAFCIASILLFEVQNLFKTPPSVKKALTVGFLAGLLVLIRPTNVLIVLVLLLHDVRSKNDFFERLSWYGQHYKMLLVALGVAVAVWIPQFVYWHHISGKWLFYSYTEAGFLNWDDPYLWQIFLHPCNGFLVYSPVMILALIGLIGAAWKNVHNGRAFLLVFLIFCYICAAWTCWWFGGTYGYRSFIDFYPLFALCFCWLLDSIWAHRQRWLRYVVSAFILFCLVVNYRMVTLFYYFQVDNKGVGTEKLIEAYDCAITFRCGR